MKRATSTGARVITGNHEGGMPPDYGGARRVDVVTQLHTVYGHGKTGRAVRQLAALAGDGVGRSFPVRIA